MNDEVDVQGPATRRGDQALQRIVQLAAAINRRLRDHAGSLEYPECVSVNGKARPTQRVQHDATCALP